MISSKITTIVIILITTVTFTFTVANDAKAMTINNVTQNADVIVNCSGENLSDKACITNYSSESNSEKIENNKKQPIDENPVKVLPKEDSSSPIGTGLTYFLMTAGGTGLGVGLYQGYKKLIPHKKVNELKDRIETLETIITKN